MDSHNYLSAMLRPHSPPRTPSLLLHSRICPFVKFQKDQLSVRYEGKGLLYTDAAGI